MAAASDAGRVGVWGRSGSGKSAYVKRRIKGQKRVVVFDPLAEYGVTGCNVVLHKQKGSLDQVRQGMAANWGGFRIAYVPPPGREAAALSALCRLMLRAQAPFMAGNSRAQMLLVVEEMNLAFPVAGGDQRCPGFAEVCSRGRHYGLNVIGLSQRIAEVGTRFRGNCTETVCFAQKGPRDHKAAAAELGGHEPELKRLGALEYLHERAGKVTPGRIRF